MPLHEFDIIQQFFTQPIQDLKNIQLGVGDDAALLTIPSGHQLVTSIDTIVSGIHFPKETPAQDIGHKSLAVSLSDMAAMGAEPSSVLLSITLPTADKTWLTDFSEGFFKLANQYSISLIGGDTSRGPLSITTVANGFVPKTQALYRHKAQVGDLIYVSGTLGDAGLALKELKQNNTNIEPALLQQLNYPQPRIELGIALREIASSAIDISDGLAADLEKILLASHLGAIIEAEKLPLSKHMRQLQHKDQVWQLALSAGDDYELCFTVPSAHQQPLKKALASIDCDYTCIGKMTDSDNLDILDSSGQSIKLQTNGYQHF